MEVNLKEMIRKKEAAQLYGNDLRHSVYKGQLPLFQFVDRLHRMDVVRAEEV